MISAFKFGLTYKENRARNNLLAEVIIDNKLGFSVHKGTYTYEDGTKGGEDSFMIVNKNRNREELPIEEFTEIIVELVNEFEQESALIHFKDDYFYYLYGNGKTEEIGKKMTIGDYEKLKEEDAFSQVRGRNKLAYVYEGNYYPTKTLDAMYGKNVGWIWK